MAAEGSRAVADASVVAKWFLSEPYRDDALRLRNDFIAGDLRLSSPALMPFEVLNALRFSRSSLDVAALHEIAKSLILYPIELHGLEGAFLDLTVDISSRTEMTVYDSSYLALAKGLGCYLYTADERFLEGLKDGERGLARHVTEYAGAGEP